jgi:hypothetical protein
LVERRESLRGQKAQESRRARLWTNTPEGREHGFPSGRKPLERRVEAGRFLRKAPERKLEIERSKRSLGRRKALKGKAQERWRLKETSEVWVG